MTDKHDDVTDGTTPLPNWKDPFLLSSIILVAILFFVETALWYREISLSLAEGGSIWRFFIGLMELVITAVFLSIGIDRTAHGRYKSALTPTLTATVLFIVFILPVIFRIIDERQNSEYHFGYPHDLAYHIKFALHEDQYLKEIQTTRSDEHGYRYKSFPWGGDSGLGWELVYDESDVLGLPGSALTYAWWWKVYGTKIDEENKEQAKALGADTPCPYRVYKVKAHFYVVHFVCG